MISKKNEIRTIDDLDLKKISGGGAMGGRDVVALSRVLGAGAMGGGMYGGWRLIAGGSRS